MTLMNSSGERPQVATRLQCRPQTTISTDTENVNERDKMDLSGLTNLLIFLWDLYSSGASESVQIGTFRRS